VSGGAGGIAVCGPPATNGVDGPASTGVVDPVPGTRRALHAPGVVREGDSLSLLVDGVPGERVVLFLGPPRSQGYAPQYFGVPHLGSVLRRLPLGTIPASGTLAASLPVPELGAGVESAPTTFQALAIDPAGVSRLTGARSLAMVDRDL
jgi:hypothetical protein